MTKRTPRAGGSLMAAALLVGTVAGVAIGQPSAGVIGGAAAAVALGLLVWLLDRRAD